MISEGAKEKYVRLAGILAEADNRATIVNNVKLPQFVADWAHAISDKFSVWIANSFRERFIEDFEMPAAIKRSVNFQKQLQRPDQGLTRRMETYMRRVEGEYQDIIDWLSRRGSIAIENDQINLRALTFQQAMARSNAWHERVAVESRQREAAEREKAEREAAAIRAAQPEAAIQDRDGKVEIAFGDGYYWLNLGGAKCDNEARLMGHCGSGAGTLYSLRKDGYPYVTVDLQNKRIRQMRGRGNSIPKAEYWPYIIEFLINPKIGVIDFALWDYKKDLNFKLEQLPPDMLGKVLKAKPNFVKEVDVDKMSAENLQILLRDSPNIIEDINVSALAVRYIQNTEKFMALIEEHPRLVTHMSISSFIELSSQNRGIVPKIQELAKTIITRYPEIIDNARIASDKFWGYVLIDKKEPFQQFLNEKKLHQSWEGEHIDIFVSDFSELSELYDPNHDDIFIRYNNPRFEVQYSPVDFPWERYVEHIDTQNAKGLAKIMKAQGADFGKTATKTEVVAKLTAGDFNRVKELISIAATKASDAATEKKFQEVTRQPLWDMGFEYIGHMIVDVERDGTGIERHVLRLPESQFKEYCLSNPLNISIDLHDAWNHEAIRIIWSGIMAKNKMLSWKGNIEDHEKTFDIETFNDKLERELDDLADAAGA